MNLSGASASFERLGLKDGGSGIRVTGPWETPDQNMD